jgi:hypothetical protein
MAIKAVISTTKNYRQFKISQENRPLDLSRRKALRDSMKAYGFLKSFPLSCVRDRDNKLVVKDGQNRLAIAEELGLSVHYFVEEVDYDIACVNNAQQKWTLKDYAMKWAAQERKHYVTLLAFIESHGIPIGLGVSLLCGHSHSNGPLLRKFRDGEFKVSDYEFADRVANVYSQLLLLSKDIKNGNCLSAIMAAMRVAGFDAKRLIDGAKRRPEKLKAYSTRDCYLEMIEDIYNFHRSKLVSIKMPALQILRDRDAAQLSSKKKAGSAK